ncbi:MAG TPA: hypothetical protein VFQ92_15350 [Blastocatellia bacterium]|nr:hypothetical protein [Blastocatellia bacterium]
MKKQAHRSVSHRALDRLKRVVLLVCLLSVFAAGSNAQSNQLPPPPLPVDPTPLEVLLSAQDKEELKKASSPQKKVEAYLKIADIHLDAALAAINASNSALAERELDIYNKTIDEAAKTAFSQDDKKRRLSKKLEQKLYKQLRTLETIERLFPLERVAFAEAAIKNARQTRVQALNAAFAGGEILKVPDEEEKKPANTKPSKSNPPDNFAPPFSMRLTGGARKAAQIPGDYLNEEEDDQVRRAQKADERAKVFMKIADRRLAALTETGIDPTDKKAQKKAEEELREWGPLPKLSRAELLRHYARAIEELITKLEDAHERNPKSSELPRALTVIKDATDRHLQILRALTPEMRDEAENRALITAIEQAEMANQGARKGLQ